MQIGKFLKKAIKEGKTGSLDNLWDGELHLIRDRNSRLEGDDPVGIQG